MWPFKYPYSNYHELNLDWILETVGGLQREFKSAKQEFMEGFDALYKKYEGLPSEVKNSYITPEMFGAKGDGIADDTAALQAAFNAAVASGKTLYSFGVTYYVTSTIHVNSPVRCEFGYSFIKCPSDMQGVVVDYDGGGYSSSFNAICFDGNNSPATMFRVRNSKNTFISNVYSLQCRNFIDVVSGYEVTLSKALLFNGDGTLGNIAIKHQSWDCHFTEVYAVNYATVFDMIGGNNRISYCHCWNTSSELWNNTRFAHIKESYNIFSACTSDTFDIGFDVAEGKQLFVYDLLAYHHEKPGCVLFAGDSDGIYVNGIQGYGRNINKLYDGVFAGRLIGITLKNYIDVPAVTSYFTTATPINNAKLDYNRVYVGDNTVTIEIHGQITFSGNTEGYVDVAQIPRQFSPISYVYYTGYVGEAYASNSPNTFAIEYNGKIRFYTSKESGTMHFALTADVKIRRFGA